MTSKHLYKIVICITDEKTIVLNILNINKCVRENNLLSRNCFIKKCACIVYIYLIKNFNLKINISTIVVIKSITIGSLK